ncbi:DUF6314 family protein [Sulfitobacter sp. D35]|uniref:DUF6314 family protein n=1 Tax=Sulfitobacter sp. D35 TaxID=3083252 RepID=UPI00296F6208|nr:DUF6314 family protein [Sulfitobacter sp. D35]MDW4496700.1 DUF6314 family protein [Sulfitobacter sp. D35]
MSRFFSDTHFSGKESTLLRAARHLDEFEGHWRLDRQIFHAEGPDALFEGEAVWIPDGADFTYVETGVLRIPGQKPMRAERQYLWKQDLSVWFSDGRFFHKVPVFGGETEHWCDPDRYAVRYAFDDWPVFSVDWTVTGPRKDYRMHSVYEPWT